TTTTTVAPGPKMEARVRVHQAITAREQVDKAYHGNPTPVLDTVRLPLDQVAVMIDGIRRLTLDLRVSTSTPDSDNTTLDLPDAGLYPITVEIPRDGIAEASHRTFVERLPDERPGRGP